MSAVPADLTISCRWLLPMTAPGVILENHTIVVRDGRIREVLPTHAARAVCAAATLHLERARHVLLPGLVNAYARLAPPPQRQPQQQRHPDGVRDDVLLSLAAMLRSGTTCIGAVGDHPDTAARAVAEQGLRAVIGMPVASQASTWAQHPDDYVTKALRLRDEYKGHPTLVTAFALPDQTALDDGALRRIATLADELEAGVVIDLHATQAGIDACVARRGTRPLARMLSLGLITPALLAVHMNHVTADEIVVAQRGGIAVACCPEASLRSGQGAPPLAQWAASGLRLGMGGDDGWSALRLLALLTTAVPPHAALRAWNALAALTRGAASALGLDHEIGSIEPGKWADLCCVDLHTASLPWAVRAGADDVLDTLAFAGGRDLVTDVWVSGRHLLNHGAFTRFDWDALATRAGGNQHPEEKPDEYSDGR